MRLVPFAALIAAVVVVPWAASYPYAPATAFPSGGSNPHGVVAADLNGDGRLDLVAANAGSNSVGVLRGNGDGTFGAATTFATGAAPKAVAVARLDGDATLDLITANQDSHTVSVLKGRGDGTFAPRTDYAACTGAHEAATGDFDGDGDADAAVACWGGSVIAVLRNAGDGTFSAPTSYVSGGNPHSIVAADHNGDGRLDLAVANRGSNNVGVLLGRGDGSFNAVTTYGVGAAPHSIRSGDLNGDGRRDLVTANDLADSVSVLLGRGDGTFTAATHFATGRVPKGVAVADLDGDGRLDVATANTAGNYPTGVLNPGGNQVSVLLGNGAGALGPPTAYTVGHTPFAVHPADLDGDGRADLVTANWFSHDLSILRHAPAGFSEVTVFSGLTNPTAIRFASDGRVFVAEKSGLIKVFDGLTDTTPTLFADLSTKVHNYWDRGLLGLELHPSFPATPYVYVLYTHDAAIGGTAPRWGTAGVLSDPCPTPPGPNADGCVVSGRLSRLQASGNTMTGSEQVLLEGWCQQYPSHSVGALAFGADGALYVSGGEGASFTFVDYGQRGSPTNPCGDPPSGVGGTQAPPSAEGGSLRAQDVRTTGDPVGLSGALLRIDPATGAGAAGNPLASSTDPNARRILAHGFRNPFRFALRPGTSEVWVGDVGANGADEIDIVPDRTLRNYGWPCYEGNGRNGGFDSADLTLCESLYSAGTATPPAYAYGMTDNVVAGEACPTGSTTLSGLTFYRGGSYPAKYDGALFFADYSRNCVWAILGGDTTRREVILSGLSSPVDLQVGPGGDLFYADLTGGTIRRIVYGSGGTTPPPPPPDSPTRYLSDLSWVSASNGWGPVERDRSNGESGSGDGRTLTLNGVTFAKGLGVHALSSVVFAVPSDCSRLRASVGVDDEVGSNGSLVFQVFAGTVKLFDSGAMTGASATQSVDVAVVGGSQVRLAVGDGGNGIAYDHGDWAGARFECADGGGGDTVAPTVTGRTPVPGATGVSVSVSPSVTFSEAMDAASISSSSFSLAPAGGSAVAASVSYDSGAHRATLDPGADLQAGVSYTVTVRGGSSGVKDVAGNALAADATWTFTTAPAAGNTAPSPTIATPATGTTWAVGDAISFSGSATDAEDGALPASRLSWEVLIQHCPSTCHSHQLQSFPGVAAGSITAPDHEYPSHLELRLTATDSAGASSTASLRLDPRTVTLTFATQPSGLQLTVGGATQTAPFTRTLIVGSVVSVSAPSPQTLSGTTLAWESWSDGGARTHELTAGPSAATLTATFADATTETRYLSDLVWSAASNGWGPVERDRSNGDSAAGDGRTLTLEGVTFEKGLGVHALSDVRFALPGGCTRFRASVGVDDEVGTRGSVVFRVLLDGVQAYDSGTMTGSTATRLVDLDVTGKAELRLVVADAGDGIAYDHADWADARLLCTAVADTTPPTVTDRSPAPDATGVALAVSPTATFSEAIDPATLTSSTFFLAASGGAPVAATVTYAAAARTATLDPAADLAAATSYTVTLKGGSSGVKDVAGNALAGDVAWSFTTASAGSATTVYLSDLTWTSMTNGWGPVERDRSNGESGASDGRTLTLNGTTFAKGLGVHAASEVRYAVPAGCTRLLASVGVDDEVGSNGSVVFQVFLGTTKIYDSGVMTGTSATASFDVAVSAGAEVRLVVTGGGDGVGYDHADWANVRFTC